MTDPVDVIRTANDQIHRFTMENGIIGLVKPDASAPVVAIQTWFGTGSIHEDDFLGAGLAHYVEHMIFKGTPSRTPGDISREISDAGGRINAYTTFDRTVFHVVLPVRHWAIGLDVLADAVQNATFPEDEWEREQTVILQEMAMNRDDPQRELGRLLWSTAYRVHPHRHPVIGYREVFLQTTREDLLAFFERHYRPDNMIVAVAGDVDPQEMEQAIREAFNDFERRMRRPVVIPAEPPQLSPRFARQTGAYEVSRAAWGWHAVSVSDPDAAALDVLAAVIGHGESSRLTLSLRDEKQLVHRIGAWSYAPGEPGIFGFSATFDPDKEAEVITAVEKEIERWRSTPFTEAEIEKAKRQVMVRTLSSLENVRGQVDSIASGEFYAGNPRFSEQYLTALEAITPDSLLEVLNRYVQPHRQTLALLTPETEHVAEEGTAREETLISAPEKFTLSNGLPVIIRQDHRLPMVNITVAAMGGLLTETESTQGIARFMSDLLPRGTSARSAAEIAETLEALGASLQPFSGLNSFGLQGRSLTSDWSKLAALLAESLRDPAFADAEVERQRSRQRAEIRAARERPLTRADQMARDALFPEHPYRWTPEGQEESVAELTAHQLRDYLNRHLLANNLAIAVFGHVDPDQVLSDLENLFGDLPAGEAVALPDPVATRELPVERTAREPRQQTIYLMAFPSVALDDEDADALDVLQAAMSGLASNLAIEVRDKRGLVYFVGATSRPGVAPGHFMLFAGTYEEAVPEIQELMEAELKRIITEGLSEAELARAREQLIGDHFARLQNNHSLAQVSALNTLYGLGYDYEFTREQRLRKVSAEDIQRAARRIFDLEYRVISVVYPAAGERVENPNRTEE